MKILLISSRFYPFKGGVENVVEHLYSKFSANHDVNILTTKVFQDTLVEDSKYKLKRIWMGAPESLKGFLIFPFRFLKSLFELNSFINKLKPDIVNYHFPDHSTLYLGMLLLLNNNFKLIVNLHGNDLQIFSKKWYLNFWFKKVLRQANSIVVNSNYMKDELINSGLGNFVEKIQIIANGFDINKANLASEDLEIPNYQYVFYVGRLVHKKGTDILIDAFSKLNYPNLKLIIEGKGEEMENLLSQVAKLNLTNRIIFKGGKCSDAEKLFLMKHAIFGVIPSRIEPFGIVALEYMYTRTPLIASKTGGLTDILEDNKNVLFFENGNSSDLKKQMERLYEDGLLREKLTKTYDEVLSNYSWQHISDLYLECFRK